MKPLPTALVLVLAFASAGCRAEPQMPMASAQAQAPQRAESGLQLVPLQIVSGSRRHDFTVEVARTEAEQAQGMMFRQGVAPDRGMIFPMEPPRRANFWMKNTYIPLDLIFVRPDGTISSIAAHAVPHSLAGIESTEPVAAVLEIGGGRSAELGIKPGDRVIWGK